MEEQTTAGDPTTGQAAYALVMALATTLHREGVLPIDRFIATIRKHALQLKGEGAEVLSDDLLGMASSLSLSLQQPPTE
ncbi:hypothetical protein ACCQ23_21300 [Xanthomonas axonopodis pv. phyllanthi]|uniref:hypothetical protein n=1 Tax=Xanthomonas axonopodis TaxID=53413 RepID=UPI00355738A5